MSFRFAVTTWYNVMDANTTTPRTFTNAASEASRDWLMLALPELPAGCLYFRVPTCTLGKQPGDLVGKRKREIRRDSKHGVKGKWQHFYYITYRAKALHVPHINHGGGEKRTNNKCSRCSIDGGGRGRRGCCESTHA